MYPISDNNIYIYIERKERSIECMEQYINDTYCTNNCIITHFVLNDAN